MVAVVPHHEDATRRHLHREGDVVLEHRGFVDVGLIEQGVVAPHLPRREIDEDDVPLLADHPLDDRVLVGDRAVDDDHVAVFRRVARLLEDQPLAVVEGRQHRNAVDRREPREKGEDEQEGEQRHQKRFHPLVRLAHRAFRLRLIVPVFRSVHLHPLHSSHSVVSRSPPPCPPAGSGRPPCPSPAAGRSCRSPACGCRPSGCGCPPSRRRSPRAPSPGTPRPAG